MFNLIFAERLEKLDKLLFLDKSKMRNEFRQKIRQELSSGLEKENMIAKCPGTGISPMKWDEVISRISPSQF